MALYRIIRSLEFDEWLFQQRSGIQDRVSARLDLMSLGHLGDHKRFEGLIELRWKNGTRVYSFQVGSTIMVLCGGGKNAQGRDIARAKRLRKRFLEGA